MRGKFWRLEVLSGGFQMGSGGCCGRKEGENVKEE